MSRFDRTSEVIKPQQVIETVYPHYSWGKHILLQMAGQHQMFAALYYPFDKPRQWINSGGLDNGIWFACLFRCEIGSS